MQNLALALDTFAPFSPQGEIAIISSGIESAAIAGILASKSLPIQLYGIDNAKAVYDMRPEPWINGYATSEIKFPTKAGSADMYVRSPDILILSAKAKDYAQAMDVVAEQLRPGQTVFVIDSPLGTVFELSQKIFKLRKRMAVNLIEMSPLFESATMVNGKLEISRLREQVSVCGRSVNETRSGISIGSKLFSGLVPSSNILERGLSDSNYFLRAAKQLFMVMSMKSNKDRQGKVSFNNAQLSLLSAMEQEIQSLGKLFNVSIRPSKNVEEQFSSYLETEKQEIASTVCNNLVLISDLAGIAYHSVPTIDSIIDLSSATLGRDLRKEGRRLADLGLIGMNTQEIIEFINS